MNEMDSNKLRWIAATLTAVALSVGMMACSESEGTNPAASGVATTASSGAGERVSIVDALGLTEEQHEQFRAAMQAHHEKMRALRDSLGESATPEERQAARDALRAELLEELGTFLTEEQLAKLEELHQQRQGRRGMRGNGPPTDEQIAERMDRRIERLVEALGLSPEQEVQVRDLFETMHANRPESRPTPEQRSQHREEIHSQLEAILTPEQMALFEELRPGPGMHRGPRGR
jgi:Spy/CpxP family protein refolding chaperone